MSKQEATQELARLLSDADTCIANARKLADKYGLYFNVSVGGVCDAYASPKFVKEYGEMDEAARDEVDLYPFEGYAGWQK